MTSSKNRIASVSPNTETSNEAIPDIKQNRDQNIELNKISLDSKKSKLGIDKGDGNAYITVLTKVKKSSSIEAELTVIQKYLRGYKCFKEASKLKSRANELKSK